MHGDHRVTFKSLKLIGRADQDVGHVCQQRAHGCGLGDVGADHGEVCRDGWTALVGQDQRRSEQLPDATTNSEKSSRAFSSSPQTRGPYSDNASRWTDQRHPDNVALYVRH